TLGTRDPQVVELAQNQAKKTPVSVRPADTLKPEWEELRASALELKGCNGTDEDVLTYARFPQVASRFFSTRDEGPKNLGKDPNAAAPAAPAGPSADTGTGPVRTTITYDVRVDGKTHKVTVSPA
ncbi:MAG TPA: oxaloacetate decarboxylase, partial [Bryobacteraceae bacterium]|nr:oxaloacetate decarboxylase [Bryobacteraceae bacterium]